MEKQICTRSSPGAGDLIVSNEDLLREILIHVPRKPLCMFKTVSKLWRSVISDPDFSLRWNTKHAGSTSALLIYLYYNYKYISLDGREENDLFGNNFGFDSVVPLLDHSRHKIEILQSCNGLLLVNLKVKKFINLKSYEVRIGVYNPRTNHSKLIPKYPQNYSNLGEYTKLAFDPSKSPHYKILSLFPVPGISRREVLMYSSETDSWKVLPSHDILTYNSSVVFEVGVYSNGAIHWPRERSNGSFYFDVDEECLSWMPMPPIQQGQEKRTIRYFGASAGGRLHLIDYKHDFTLQFDVFEMEKDYSKWFVKYSVDLSALGWGSTKNFTILSFIVKNGDKVGGGEEEWPILVMYVPADKMVISYNLKKEESKKLCPLSLNHREMDNLKTKNWSMIYHITY